MELIFNIDYRTAPEEQIVVDILAPRCTSLRLSQREGERWSGSIAIPDNHSTVSYRYRVERPGVEPHRDEWGEPHRLDIPVHCDRIDIRDRWQEMPADKPFYSQAFTNCINRRTDKATPLFPSSGFMLLSASVPTVSPDETVVIAGSCDLLGNWDIAKAPEMNSSRFPLWQSLLPLDSLPHEVEYKLVVVKRDDRSVVEWEQGANRYLSTANMNRTDAVCVNGLLFNHSTPSWRGAGVAIPVFSLRSDEDCGIGDFIDLIKMVDWAASTGQRFIQILPINDTTMTGTWTDSYPYNANSTFALHPMYLRLQAMGTLNDAARREHYRSLAGELNALKAIDYEKVMKVKLAYMNELFDQEGDITLSSREFKEFFNANEAWLKPYAAFCVLRDIYHTPCFECWEQYSRYDRALIDSFIDSHRHAIGFVYYQQFHLDKQLRHVSLYAREHGVAIKGDIPIGISRTSVDAWISPRLFNLDCQAGAPPDDFSANGQNWGFPTYNWEEMSLDGFAWWRSRFTKMAEYFDAYRIDHVLGFFRIWEIPSDAVHGLLGYFNEALPLSPAEMQQMFDFTFDKERHTKPYITDRLVNTLFGEFSDEVKSTFLYQVEPGRYLPHSPYRTQRAIDTLFGPLEKNHRNRILRNGLMQLLDEVLFIEDPRAPGLYHPRISGNKTHMYSKLSDYQRWCYDRLYNDFFYYRHDDFWKAKAMWKLPPLIDATAMLTCAEDLGMIPACVPHVIHDLEILSLEIQRMPKAYGVRFDDPSRYPYYSVCTTSTHDMSGIRGWWEEDRKATEAFYHDILQESGKAPHFAEPRVCDMIVRMHLDSPAMLCILPLQDWMSVDGRIRRDNPNDERINVPAESRHYWRYRMHLTLEELTGNEEFNTRIATMIKDSGRS